MIKIYAMDRKDQLGKKKKEEKTKTNSSNKSPSSLIPTGPPQEVSPEKLKKQALAPSRT